MQQDALLRLWDTQEQLEGAQVELTRLRVALTGFQTACELLWSATMNSETQRMQETADCCSARRADRQAHQSGADHAQAGRRGYIDTCHCTGCALPAPFFPASDHAQLNADIMAFAGVHSLDPDMTLTGRRFSQLSTESVCALRERS